MKIVIGPEAQAKLFEKKEFALAKLKGELT
jgi:hypothetical protein